MEHTEHTEQMDKGRNLIYNLFFLDAGHPIEIHCEL